MKFFKEYSDYMRGQHEKNLPVLGFKAFKKMLKHCRCDHAHSSTCADECPVGDVSFFPSLSNEMLAVVGCFNDRVQELVKIHLATGLRKFLLSFNDKSKNNPANLIQECHDLIKYAIINAIAMRKILKKYDKIHYSNQGQTFKSEAQRMHIEILQSPWLCELMACYINLREKKVKEKTGTVPYEVCSFSFSDEKPLLICEFFDSMKVHVDLTCAICLNTVYDAVALNCGHIFCYICACSAASVNIVDGLKIAAPEEKCPICREAAVYGGALRLAEVNTLVRRRCPEYWKERFLSERRDRYQLTKAHWDSQVQYIERTTV
ncbi:hypothetical protein V2J09_009262 [Rumex salicifolius]